MGQGAQVEATLHESSALLARLRASCYSFLAKQIVLDLGLDCADPLLRSAIRTWGRYRGEMIRTQLEERGLPLDVEHLRIWWDQPSPKQVYGIPEGTVHPHYSAHEVLGCPVNDLMSELCPEPLMILYCEEIHDAVAKAVNPEIDVWYPALLTRGQSKCVFRFTMSQAAAFRAQAIAREARDARKAAGLPVAQDIHEAAPWHREVDPVTCHTMLARLFYRMYHFVANELARAVGRERAMSILRKAMREWGAWRGKDMCQDHLRRGWPLTVENFVKFYDDPCVEDAWVVEEIHLDAVSHHRTVTKSVATAIFDEMGTGLFALPLYEEAVPAQARAYHPAMRLDVLQLMERGDEVSEYQIVMS